MTVEEVRSALRMFKLTVVAKELDINYDMLTGFASGRVKNPNIEMYEKLKEFLR